MTYEVFQSCHSSTWASSWRTKNLFVNTRRVWSRSLRHRCIILHLIVSNSFLCSSAELVFMGWWKRSDAICHTLKEGLIVFALGAQSFIQLIHKFLVLNLLWLSYFLDLGGRVKTMYFIIVHTSFTLGQCLLPLSWVSWVGRSLNILWFVVLCPIDLLVNWFGLNNRLVASRCTPCSLVASLAAVVFRAHFHAK